DRMVGGLDPMDVSMYMVVKGIRPAGYITLIQVPGSHEHVSVEALRAVSRIEVGEVGGRPRIKIRSHVDGAIREKAGGRLDLGSLGQVQALEQAIARSVEQDVTRLVKKTQKDGSDIFGFGEQIRARMFPYWKARVRTKQDWEAMYSSLTVQVEATVNIRRVGTLNR
ncbi:MAG: Ger(x)C family spore germination C-terminal domain-containing protein, partial [Kyrpidia sp.]|nr:Ger(x)C family spore germination C-terminal domain-containing protein [Kyrpidia sp.]